MIEGTMRTNVGLGLGQLRFGILLNLTAVLLASIAFAITYLLNRSILPVVMELTNPVLLGLTSGFVTRWSLSKNTQLLRWLIATVSSVGGLLFIGWLSSGMLGFDIAAFPRTSPDLEGLLQIGLASISAWLAINAWISKEQGSGRHPHNREINAPQTRATAPGLRLSPLARTATSLSSGSPAAAEPRRRAFAGLGRRLRFRRPNNRALERPSFVRLGGLVENRCPYCLEEILGNDVRGVIECSICRTQHHADCWAETGACQVPHYQA